MRLNSPKALRNFFQPNAASRWVSSGACLWGARICGAGVVATPLWATLVLALALSGILAPRAASADDTVSREDVRRQLHLVYNYPNPFNPSTTIDYVLLESSHVEVWVYDLKGRRLVCLVDEVQDAGPNFAVWKTRDAPSGTYIFSLEAGGVRIFHKMSLIR